MGSDAIRWHVHCSVCGAFIEKGMVFAGCREMSIPNVSGFTISTIS